MGKKIYIRMDKYYGWGVGYRSPELREEFDNKVVALAKELHANLTIPTTKTGVCMRISDYWGDLYCHPMEITGFVGAYEIDNIVEACKTVGLEITRVDIYDKVNWGKKEEVFGEIINKYKSMGSKEFLEYLEHEKCVLF